MRMVKFIKSLNVDLIPLTGNDMKYYSQNFTVVDDIGKPAFLHTEVQVKEHVVPINIFSQIRKGKRTETYIAYSEEVQELLEMPFKSINEQLYLAEKYKRKIETATWINRLLYVFTGKLR